MSRLYHFILLTLAAISAAGLPTPVAAAEPDLETDWFVGPWDIDYRALVLRSGEAKLKTDRGAEFSDYVLSFTAQARFVVEKDRVVARVKGKPTAPQLEQVDEKGGKVRFEQHRARFLHRAHWKTSDGAPGDYAFNAAGVLQGSGQFTARALQLNLKWTTGEGHGKSGGQRISEPAGGHTWKSEWTLKPESPAKADLAGAATPRLVLAATRTTPMPQQLAGCPPLPLIEFVRITRAPTADLELKVKKLDASGSGRGRYELTVVLRNLGPEASPPSRLGIALPDDAVHQLTGENVVADDDHLVSLLLPALEATQSREIKIPFRLDAAPDMLAEGGYLILVEVKNLAHDPNPGNNGVIQQLSAK